MIEAGPLNPAAEATPHRQSQATCHQMPSENQNKQTRVVNEISALLEVTGNVHLMGAA